jgi:hypothetical protein
MIRLIGTPSNHNRIGIVGSCSSGIQCRRRCKVPCLTATAKCDAWPIPAISDGIRAGRKATQSRKGSFLCMEANTPGFRPPRNFARARNVDAMNAG